MVQTSPPRIIPEEHLYALKINWVSLIHCPSSVSPRKGNEERKLLTQLWAA